MANYTIFWEDEWEEYISLGPRVLPSTNSRQISRSLFAGLPTDAKHEIESVAY